MKKVIKMRAWYWRHGFMLGAHDYVLDREKRPYRRFAATLIVGLTGDVHLDIAEDVSLTTRAIIIAPKVLRRKMVAVGADAVIIDVHVSEVEYPALEALLGGEQYRELDVLQLAPVRDALMGAVTGEIAPGQVYSLVKQVVAAYCGESEHLRSEFPTPVRKVLDILESTPMDQLSMKELADRVFLSESRLRAVFSKHMGCTVGEYMRWLAVWKAIWLWSVGQPLIDVAVDIGFYDLAHLNKAFNEIFGMNPSDVFKSEHVEVFRCDS